jgi:subtilisin family serine protease
MDDDKDGKRLSQGDLKGDSFFGQSITESQCRNTCRPMLNFDPDVPWWLPGIVVVEFKNPIRPEIFTNGTASDKELENLWLDVGKVLQILNGETQIKKPQWTFSYDSRLEFKPDRQRFITFYFDVKAVTVQIAEYFRAVRGVVNAAPEPKLAPPLRLSSAAPRQESTLGTRSLEDPPLLNEPLATSGGASFGIAVQNASGIQNQWYLFRSKANIPLSQGKSGTRVVVADIDWGFRVSHQDIGLNRIEHRRNVKTGTQDVTQGSFVSHGTGVLGILWANDNDRGLLGIAHGAALWAIQADDGTGHLDNCLWAKAIDHVVAKSSAGRPKVILIETSTEKGGNVEMSPTVRQAIINALAVPKIVVCVPAGNLGIPAHLDHAGLPIPVTGSILIGATKYCQDPSILRRGLSNFGPRVDVSAPGDTGYDVTCCNCGDNNYTNTFGGTSGAAAKVAGAVALMLAANPELTHQRVRQILKTVGTDILLDKPIGKFLDVAEAVRQAELDRKAFKKFLTRVFRLIRKLLGRL